MADVYRVGKGGAVAFESKDTTSNVTFKYSEGNTVKIYEKGPGANNQQYGNAANSGTPRWIVMSALTKISGGSTSNNSGIEAENTDTVQGQKSITGNSDKSYAQMMLRYLHAFGSPPRFTEEVDPYYDLPDPEIQTGRVMSGTWFSNPSILSLCPGTVDYLPGFSSKKKNQFFSRIKGAMTDGILNLAEADNEIDSNGQLYAFKSRYTDYMNVVNMLARVAARLMGLQNVTNIIYGSSIPLGDFDYGYYTTASGAKASKNLFDETKRVFNSAVGDDHYIHFFINHSGTSVSESISTTAGQSYLEKQFGSESNFSELAQNIQFLFGGAITPEASADIESVMKEARTQSEFLGGMATIAKNYLNGGRLVFPKMITGMDYSKALSVELKFTSIYGDKRSIFKYVILPSLHLLALATPKQLSSNMYTYPYLVRAFETGSFSSDLAFIQKLDFSRGGDDGTCWTVDGLPTEITARFEIVPLYSNLMVTSATDPLLLLKNTALLEYLGNMCGVDLKLNNLDAKVDLALRVMKNKALDIPTNIARSVIDSRIYNEIKKLTSLIG